ncbi:MAG: hypothetical protein LBT02_03565 [Rickettsiales bacterium]|jgi:hypothetical protein|nr:hypothetical protein [Rickettsiales bacterium]
MVVEFLNSISTGKEEDKKYIEKIVAEVKAKRFAATFPAKKTPLSFKSPTKIEDDCPSNFTEIRDNIESQKKEVTKSPNTLPNVKIALQAKDV